jgi:hypothetical protein
MELAFLTADMKKKCKISIVFLLFSCISAFAQQEKENNDSFPRPIPDFLSSELFIPKSRLLGFRPWTFAPLPRPVVYILPTFGAGGSIGFGEYSMEHPEKFFSTLEGYNTINIPMLYVTEQMMIGNTLKLGKNIYLMSGILYGAQMGIMGNNWGMGTREGFIIHPSSVVSITIWNQYFQSVSVYSPVMYPNPSGDGAAIRMPATPEVFSFGVQATFVVGEFIIDIGASVAPVPYQKRQHSEFHYK